MVSTSFLIKIRKAESRAWGCRGWDEEIPPEVKRVLSARDQYLKISSEWSKSHSGDLTYVDLWIVRGTWDKSQEDRSRVAIYRYLTALYRLVRKWTNQKCLDGCIRHAIEIDGGCSIKNGDPFSVVIYCTSSPAQVDKRTRSKWASALRFVQTHKPKSERLMTFMRKNGGINGCASKGRREIGGALKRRLHSCDL
jgi:hypothetical protein